MMKNKIIILSFLLLVLMGSCNCVETHLSKEEREWFSAYEKGQTIIFKSNRGNLDTIVVVEKVETYGNKECNWFEIGTIQNNMIDIVFKSKNCRNESDCEGNISISKDKPNEKRLPFFRIFGLEYAPATQNNELRTENIKLTNGKAYESAYYFEDQINADSYGGNYLKSFYWDKKDGLIRYDLIDGEIFELLKK
jgi:hypothetical protein